MLPLPPPRRPSPGAAAPTDPRSGGGGGGTEAQEAEQEASPAAAFSWGSGGRGGAASGAREPPPSRWGEFAALRVGKLPGAGSSATVPAFVSGTRMREAARRRGRRAGQRGLAGWLRGSRHRSLVPAGRQLSAEDRLRNRGRGGWWGVRVEREDEPSWERGPLLPAPATRRPAEARVVAEGARVGMNDQPPAGRSGCAQSAPCPTCLAGPAPDSPGSPLLDSTRLRAELGGGGEEGASGRLGGLGRPRVRYCSFSDFRSPQLVQGCRRRRSGRGTDPRSRFFLSFSLAQLREGLGGKMLEFGPTPSSWDLGRREDVEPREGLPPAIHSTLCSAGWVPSLTHPLFNAGLGRFLCLLFSFCSLQSSSANP